MTNCDREERTIVHPACQSGVALRFPPHSKVQMPFETLPGGVFLVIDWDPCR